MRGVKIKSPDHVWSSDITYVRMRHGFLYLVAVIDWHSRYVLSSEVSNTLNRDLPRVGITVDAKRLFTKTAKEIAINGFKT